MNNMYKKNSSLFLVSLLVWCCFAFGQVQAAVSDTDAAAASQLVKTLILDDKMNPADAVKEALKQYPGAYKSVVAAALGVVSEEQQASVITAAKSIAGSNTGSNQEVMAGIKAAGVDTKPYSAIAKNQGNQNQGKKNYQGNGNKNNNSAGGGGDNSPSA